MHFSKRGLLRILALSALLIAGPSLYAQNQISLECPATISCHAVDTPIGVKVNYRVGPAYLFHVSVGFHYVSDLIDADSISTTGTHVPNPAFFNPTRIDSALNLVLRSWDDYTGGMPIPANDSGLLFTIWFTVPAGVSGHCMDIDSSYMAPGGEFIFSLVVTGENVTPDYVDCGSCDLIVRAIECGDANGDCLVNITDCVHVITYIFASGPPPVSLEVGDVNLDGIVNITDAVYLILYVFGSGPPPCGP